MQNENSIALYSNFKLKDEFGKPLMNDSTEFNLIFYKDSILCRIESNGEEMINGELKTSKPKYNYLLFRQNDKYGLLNDTLNINRVVKIDSVFSFYYSTINQNFYDPIQKKYLNLIDSTKMKDELIKRYIFYDSVQKANGEWHFFLTEKYKQLPFSLPKQLDSITKMKLYKFKIIVFNNLQDKSNTSTVEIGFNENSYLIRQDLINWKRKLVTRNSLK